MTTQAEAGAKARDTLARVLRDMETEARAISARLERLAGGLALVADKLKPEGTRPTEGADNDTDTHT